MSEETKYMLILYREDSVETCRGCVMERNSSLFEIFRNLTQEEAYDKLLEYKAGYLGDDIEWHLFEDTQDLPSNWSSRLKDDVIARKKEIEEKAQQRRKEEQEREAKKAREREFAKEKLEYERLRKKFD